GAYYNGPEDGLDSDFLFAVRPAVRAPPAHQAPLPAAREGRHAGARRVALLAVPRHGTRHVHQPHAGRAVSHYQTIAASPGAGHVPALGPQAAAQSANAERAAAREALRKKSMAERRPPVYTPKRSFLFGGLTRALQTARWPHLPWFDYTCAFASGTG